MTDDFCKYFSTELEKSNFRDGKITRNRPSQLSDAELISMLILFHSKDF